MESEADEEGVLKGGHLLLLTKERGKNLGSVWGSEKS